MDRFSRNPEVPEQPHQHQPGHQALLHPQCRLPWHHHLPKHQGQRSTLIIKCLYRCNFVFTDNEEQLPSGDANQELALEESDPEDGG